MTELDGDNESIELGPQSTSDNVFTKRMRQHQSWYRAEILGLPFGTGPQRDSIQYYGNVLTENDAEAGANFLNQEIQPLPRLKGPASRLPLTCTSESAAATRGRRRSPTREAGWTAAWRRSKTPPAYPARDSSRRGTSLSVSPGLAPSPRSAVSKLASSSFPQRPWYAA
jgi:hypothetical protein